MNDLLCFLEYLLGYFISASNTALGEEGCHIAHTYRSCFAELNTKSGPLFPESRLKTKQAHSAKGLRLFRAYKYHSRLTLSRIEDASASASASAST
jgi:hypothetical protein